MTVKGRPEKIQEHAEGCTFHAYKDYPNLKYKAEKSCTCGKNDINETLDADTEYFVSVLEGLKVSIPENDFDARIKQEFNARIEGVLKSIKGVDPLKV